MKKKKKLPRLLKKLGIIELPEEFTGKNLQTWSRRKKIPILKRKMTRRVHEDRTRIHSDINTILHKNSILQKYENGELTFIRRYQKGDVPMKRTKFKMKRTKFKNLKNR